MDKVVATELTDADMEILLPHTPITKYGDLQGKSLGHILDHEGRGIIFFAETETGSSLSGHWLAVARQPDGVLLFDPYGGTEDPWFLDHTWVSARTNKSLDQTGPFLQQLVQASGLRPLYNKHRLQRMKEGINTCGRHCVVRLWHSTLDSDAYAELLHAEHGNPDMTVAKLTYDKLGH